MDYILFLILMIKLKAICLFMKMFRIYGWTTISFGGGSSSSRDIDTFNYADSHQAMVVVYGKNKQNASQYSFVNDGKVYEKEINDSHILDIYMLDGASCHIDDWTLYDQNHQVIQNEL